MHLNIAGVRLPLTDEETITAELDALYAEFATRTAAYAADPANVHLCFAGCSLCCKSGAFFAVTLAEALRLSRAVEALQASHRDAVRTGARALLDMQARAFEGDPPDVPGDREPRIFAARVARVARTGVACPLLEGDLCSIYPARPFLCRAYGFPTDAYAVEDAATMTFRSLCRLYEGHALRDWVRARDLRARLTELSCRLAGGREVGRFTSAEAILAFVEH